MSGQLSEIESPDTGRRREDIPDLVERTFGIQSDLLSIANGSDLEYSRLLLSRRSSVHEKVSTCCAKLGFLIKADRKASCFSYILSDISLHCRLSDGSFIVLGGYWYPFAQIH